MEAIVDDEDYEYLNQWKWCAQFNNFVCYAVRMENGTDCKRIKILMHRVVFNAQQGQKIDHENRNGLDNRKKNLRISSSSQNAYNAKKHVDAVTSIYKGVYFVTGRNKWRADIVYDKKRLFLGYFNSEIDAAKAYNEASIKHHGDFSRINKIKEV